MQVSKWGNSLAVRIPKDVVEALKLEEGDNVEIRVASDGAFELAHDRSRERALARIAELARPLPPGWTFDRDEANAR